MAGKIVDWAILLVVIGLILVVWFQPTADIDDNRQAITDNARPIGEVKSELLAEIAGLRTEMLGAIAGNAQAITGLRTEMVGEIAGLRTDMVGAISGVRNEMVGAIAGLDVKISELGRTIEREFFRNISSNSEHIRDLDRRITDLEGGEP